MTYISLEPSYNQTAQDLYLKIATYSIQTTKNFEVFRYVHHYPTCPERLSWVPQWDEWHVCPKFGISEWAASGSLAVDYAPKVLSENLCRRGVALDVVREVHIFQGSDNWEVPPTERC